MASGTPCLNSRWDQSKPKTTILQGIRGDVSGPTITGPVVGLNPVAGPGNAAATNPSSGTPSQGGAEMAAAMAAKINAMLMAKGKLKPLQPLPSKAPPSVAPPTCTEEIVITEVDINDVPVNCRNLLTKSKTQEEIHQYSGAAVSTRGLYMSDGERSFTGGERPLYLHVQGRTQDQVNKAVSRIKELIAEDVIRSSGGQQPAIMPTVPVYPQPPRPCIPTQPRAPTPRPPNTPVMPAHRPPPPHAGSFVHTKLFVGLERCLPDFHVNEKVEGPSGSYLQHIQTETGARVFLRGKGSGYIEQASRRESFEPLYLYISHPNAVGLEAAKKLCESLLQTVRAEHARMASTYTAPTQVSYPAHGYSSSSGSYSAQSWYSYPSTYPTYPSTGSYWSQAPTAESSNMVQYPVCPRPSTFILQDEEVVSGGAVNDSSADSNSNSPKRHFIEESEEDGEKENTQIKPDLPVTEAVCSTNVEVSKPDRVLMPPPALPVVSLPPPLKRPREEEPTQPHTDKEEELKKVKVSEVSSALVPYGGDSSDEEETYSVKRSTAP